MLFKTAPMLFFATCWWEKRMRHLLRHFFFFPRGGKWLLLKFYHSPATENETTVHRGAMPQRHEWWKWCDMCGSEKMEGKLKHVRAFASWIRENMTSLIALFFPPQKIVSTFFSTIFFLLPYYAKVMSAKIILQFWWVLFWFFLGVYEIF